MAGISDFVGRIRRNKNFLTRMILSFFGFISIPVILALTLVMNNDYKIMKALQIEEAVTRTKEATLQLEDFLAELRMLSFSIMTDRYLQYDVLQEHVYNEVEAIRWIKYTLLTVPFVEELGVYFTGTDYGYTSSGKYSIQTYEQYILGIDGFGERLNSVVSADIIGQCDGLSGNRMVYMYSSRFPSRKTLQTVMFILLNKATFEKIFATTISVDLSLVSVFDPQGRHIFFDRSAVPAGVTEGEYDRLLESGNEEYMADGSGNLFFVAENLEGYRIVVTTPTQVFLHKLETHKNTMRIILLVMISVFILLMMFVVWFDYLPVKRLIANMKQRYNAQDRIDQESDEFEIIYNILDQNVTERNSILEDLRNKRDIVESYLLNKLLDCRSLSAKERALLDMENDYYLVAIAGIDDLPDIATIKNRLEGNFIESEKINVIERPLENHVVILFRVFDEHFETAQAYMEDLRKRLDTPEATLGCSDAFKGVKRFYQAYLKSACALKQVENEHGRVMFYEKCEAKLPNDTFCVNEMIALTEYVKNGNISKALDTLDGAFGNLSKYRDESIKQYYGLLMARSYMDLMTEIPSGAKAEWLSAVEASADMEDLQNLFVSNVKSSCIEVKRIRKELEEHRAEEIVSFVDENYRDVMICLDDICERFNTVNYTVSRIFKEHTGSGFRKYINKRRVELSKELLRDENNSINDIAEYVGFSSSSYFISIFKTIEGVTPAHYRKTL